MKEYKVFKQPYNDRKNDDKLLQTNLDYFAKEGWELKQLFFCDHLYGMKEPLVLIFEREKKEVK